MIASHEQPDQLDRQLAYAVFRLTMGINLFLHGYVRIVAGVQGFANTMAEGFVATPLPQSLVIGFLTILPFIEAIIGGLIILGLFNRIAMVAGGLLISSLVFGTALKSDWGAVGLQMTYALAFFFLLFYASYNHFSLDRLLWSKSETKK